MRRQIQLATKNGLVMLAFGLVLLSRPAFAEPTAQDVLRAYFDALGGREKISAIETLVKRGSFVLEELNMETSLESINSGANFRYKVVIDGMGEITQAVTDGTVWQVSFMEGDSVMLGDKAQDVIRQAEQVPLVNWKELHSSVNKVEDEDGHYKLVFHEKGSGEKVTACFNKDTGLLEKLIQPGSDGTLQTIILSDYRKVSGVLFAFRNSIDAGMKVELVYDSIEVNSVVDPAVFAVPEVIRAQLEPQGITAAELMETMDFDGDGQITLEEAPDQLRESFTMIDMNGDKGIDVTEMELVADFINNQ